jgi:hypothetical protein
MSGAWEPYFSYLLRLWLVENQEGCIWRCSIENVRTGERQGFASLESLCDFLRQETGLLPDDELENDEFVS